MTSAYWGLPPGGTGVASSVGVGARDRPRCRMGARPWPPMPTYSWWRPTGPDFFAVERYAGALALYVLNSWGTPEFAGESADGSACSDPGVSHFACTPDMSDETQYPATYPNVVAVGGDELTAGGVAPWSSGGGGCSAYE